MYSALLRDAICVFMNPPGDVLSRVTVLNVFIAKCVLSATERKNFSYYAREENNDGKSGLSFESTAVFQSNTIIRISFLQRLLHFDL